MRPDRRYMVRRQLRQALQAHGTGRHSNEDMALLGQRAIGSIETILDDKPYFTSGTPCGAEETVYAFLSSAACPMFTSHLRKVIETHANLMTYIERMTNRYFPELAKRA